MRSWGVSFLGGPGVAMGAAGLMAAGGATKLACGVHDRSE